MKSAAIMEKARVAVGTQQASHRFPSCLSATPVTAPQATRHTASPPAPPPFCAWLASHRAPSLVVAPPRAAGVSALPIAAFRSATFLNSPLATRGNAPPLIAPRPGATHPIAGFAFLRAAAHRRAPHLVAGQATHPTAALRWASPLNPPSRTAGSATHRRPCQRTAARLTAGSTAHRFAAHRAAPQASLRCASLLAAPLRSPRLASHRVDRAASLRPAAHRRRFTTKGELNAHLA